MNMVCKRLPPSADTLRFLSPWFAKPHIAMAMDDRMKSAFGLWSTFQQIMTGFSRVYGVFELDPDGNPLRFMGFELGNLDRTGCAFENHAFWDRDTPAAECVKLCKVCMFEDYEKDGIVLSSAVGYIPDCNRAAKWMALRAGARDMGLRNDMLYLKNGEWSPCREFRVFRTEPDDHQKGR